MLLQLHLLACRQMLPMVVFCFSKKRVDALAANLGSLDMATGAEKAHAHRFCDRALSRLHPSDRNLPQVCCNALHAHPCSSRVERRGEHVLWRGPIVDRARRWECLGCGAGLEGLRLVLCGATGF